MPITYYQLMVSVHRQPPPFISKFLFIWYFLDCVVKYIVILIYSRCNGNCAHFNVNLTHFSHVRHAIAINSLFTTVVVPISIIMIVIHSGRLTTIFFVNYWVLLKNDQN